MTPLPLLSLPTDNAYKHLTINWFYIYLEKISDLYTDHKNEKVSRKAVLYTGTAPNVSYEATMAIVGS